MQRIIIGNLDLLACCCWPNEMHRIIGNQELLLAGMLPQCNAIAEQGSS